MKGQARDKEGGEEEEREKVRGKPRAREAVNVGKYIESRMSEFVMVRETRGKSSVWECLYIQHTHISLQTPPHSLITPAPHLTPPFPSPFPYCTVPPPFLTRLIFSSLPLPFSIPLSPLCLIPLHYILHPTFANPRFPFCTLTSLPIFLLYTKHKLHSELRSTASQKLRCAARSPFCKTQLENNKKRRVEKTGEFCC